MAGKPFRYDEMIEEALRGVVRRVLRQTAENGLPGGHHFYITFKTSAPGVDVSDYLREKYPDEMTIVLQYEYSHLEVDDEAFSVTLSFSDILERLTVPFAALTSFADPSSKFGYQFQLATGAASAEVPARSGPAKRLGGAPPALIKENSVPAAMPAKTGTESKQAEDEAATDKVVTLDSFRRK